jgi:hypothetical protein
VERKNPRWDYWEEEDDAAEEADKIRVFPEEHVYFIYK